MNIVTVIACKLHLDKKDMAAKGEAGSGMEGMGQAGTGLPSQPAGRRWREEMLAMLAQAQQEAWGRNWEGAGSSLPLPLMGWPCQLPSKGLMLSPLHELPTPDPPGGP